MKKLLLSATALVALTAAASAADLPARAAPPPIAAVPLFTWTGFYVGAQVGYGWTDNDNFVFDGTPFIVDGARYQVIDNGFFDEDDGDGFVAGAHVGYNVQIGSLVVGAEADIEWADFGDDNGVTVRRLDPLPVTDFTFRHGNDVEFIGSLRGRIGFALDRTLIYATGGLAFASFDNNNDVFFNTWNDGDDTEWGWTLGVGVEYAFTNNLTARVEYRYTTFDHDGNRFFNNTAFDRDDADFHTIRAGVSFKFGTY